MHQPTFLIDSAESKLFLLYPLGEIFNGRIIIDIGGFGAKLHSSFIAYNS
jgi:hypothetical protein